MLGSSTPLLPFPLPTVAGDKKGASRGLWRQPNQLTFTALPTGMGTFRFSQRTQCQEGPRLTGGVPLGSSQLATNRPPPEEAPVMTAI